MQSKGRKVRIKNQDKFQVEIEKLLDHGKINFELCQKINVNNSNNNEERLVL